MGILKNIIYPLFGKKDILGRWKTAELLSFWHEISQFNTPLPPKKINETTKMNERREINDPKIIPLIYFHGGYNGYREHNKIIEYSMFLSTQHYFSK